MLRLIVVLTFLFSAHTVNAKSVYVVELVSFYCDTCKNLNAHLDNISDLVKATGGRFVVAPLPKSLENVLLERVYYSSRHDQTLEKLVRKALFSATSLNVPFTSIEAVIDWLRINISSEEYDWKQIEADAKSKSSYLPLSKAAKIVKQLHITEVPAFVIVDGDKLELIQAAGDFNTRIKAVVQAVNIASKE